MYEQGSKHPKGRLQTAKSTIYWTLSVKIDVDALSNCIPCTGTAGWNLVGDSAVHFINCF